MVKYDELECKIEGEVRLIDGNDSKLVKMEEAILIAEQVDLDLVVISQDSNPPVVKILDFGKFLYQKAKKEKVNKSISHGPKEIKFHINIESNDYNTKIRHVEKFLSKKLKVKITIAFRGREIQFKALGYELIERIKSDLSGIAKIDNEVKFQGRQAFMMVSPK